MSTHDTSLKDYYCNTCKRKVFRGSFYGDVEVKCQGCKSIARFISRPEDPVDFQTLEKIEEKEKKSLDKCH